MNLEHFLKISHEFRLGTLDTESCHPKTIGLAELAVNNLEQAIEVLKEVDVLAIKSLLNSVKSLESTRKKIKKCLENKGRIILVGCGATGRLSLALERYWRCHLYNGTSFEDHCFSFIAGGDVALIHSIEEFEDNELYAVRTLREFGLNENDFLIGITEGGETPYVLSACVYASDLCTIRPDLYFCNPKSQLVGLTKRTTNVLESSLIDSHEILSGPMALSGSTRMQASTVQMYGIGLAMKSSKESIKIDSCIKEFIRKIKTTSFAFLKDFIISESLVYKNSEIVNYKTTKNLAIHVLTDTTERAPTFSLNAFENSNDAKRVFSWCYLFIDEENSEDAWRNLLGRAPRCLEWPETIDKTSYERLLGFDISQVGYKLRGENNNEFKIFEKEHEILFSFNKHSHNLNCSSFDNLEKFLLLKMLLNIHSTLVMGRLGRYRSNIMTYVKASNNKLIDRAIRYIVLLCEQDNIKVGYDQAAKVLFDCIKIKENTSPIVLEAYKVLSSKS